MDKGESAYLKVIKYFLYLFIIFGVKKERSTQTRNI